VQSASITFYGEGAVEIPDGSTYSPPFLDGIAPSSTGVVTVTIANGGSTDLTIESIEILRAEGVVLEEIRQSKPGATKFEAATLDGAALPAGGKVSLGLFFWPFQAGPRTAEIVVHTSDGEQGSFVFEGRGRDNLVFSPTVSMSLERVWGAVGKAQLRPGGGVSDGEGGVVLSGNVDELYDKFNPDLVLSRMKPDGTLAWAKTWSEPYHQKVPEPNKETGGSADAIAYGEDGHVYVGASRSTDSSNSEATSFQALVYKVKAADGSLAWAKGLRNTDVAQAWAGTMGYAIDASLPDRVIVAGYSGSTPQWFLAALKKDDGSLLYSRILDVAGGGLASKVLSIRVAADGTGYLGGDSDGRAAIGRLTGLDGASPSLDWVAYAGTGIGSRIESLDLAEDGSALAAVFIGGADRDFVGARIKTDGSLAWAKWWDSGNHGANNVARLARRRGSTVFFGGKIAVQAADTTSGDGFVLALDVETGDYKTGGMFYGGKTTTTVAQHLVKGLVFQGNDVFTVIDGTPGSNNTDHYWGFWYQPPTEKLELPLDGDGSERLKDYPAVAITKIADRKLTPLLKSASVVGDPGYEVTVFEIPTAKDEIWKDVSSADAVLVDSRAYEHGAINHFLLQKLTIND
jgi:hypothetical protein